MSHIQLHHPHSEYQVVGQRHQTLQQQRAQQKPVHKTTSTKSKEDWDASKPDASFVTSTVASSTLKNFLAKSIKDEGFEKAEPDALYRFEREVVAFVEEIFTRAKEFADNSSRSMPTAADALAACEQYDLDVVELKKLGRKSRKRKRGANVPQLVPYDRRSASPELLASDDESTTSPIPQTLLRSLPPHLPPLPPKHTYLRTPAPPPKKQAIPSLEKRLENAALVQESLRNLLLSTEVDTDQNDGELFGGVVNWEATRQPRKKWKIRW